MHRIAWDIKFSVFPCYFFNAVCGIISPAGLMITECPQLWKWSPSGQIGITAHNVRHRIPCDKIVIKVSGVRTIVKICLIFFSKVYIRSVCIVKENTVNTFFFQGDQKRNGFVQCAVRIRVCLWDIGVPVFVLIIPLIQKSGLVPKSVKLLIPVHFFDSLHRIAAACTCGHIMSLCL